jgi:hypothetical protein
MNWARTLIVRVNIYSNLPGLAKLGINLVSYPSALFATALAELASEAAGYETGINLAERFLAFRTSGSNPADCYMR